MTDGIYGLQNTFLYLTFDGQQYEIPLMMIVVPALILMLIDLVFLIILVLKRSKSDVDEEEETILTPETMPKRVKMTGKAKEKSLSQMYADKRGMVICPFCETFNRAEDMKCCACGRTIGK